MRLLLAVMLAAAQGAGVPERGISETLARERAAAIRNLRYDLAFDIPRQAGTPVRGRATIRFELTAAREIVLDYAGGPVDAVRSAHGDVAPTEVNGHLVIPSAATRAGTNELTIDFTAGNAALNRNPDFLHTLFVPARAHLAFPAFDQPDLKARYTLTLDVPSDWEAVGNGAEVERTTAGDGRTRIRFAETVPLPTYLFSFAAGRFQVETAVRNGRRLRMFHRETDPARVARNREDIFDLHATALEWLESYTAIPYAFGKFDFVVIPSFQFGGMEHAGAILYNASRLLLDQSATQNQRLERASLIAHETAHMWFGDLVTMEWFNDVWMKEVFANFMAAKIVNPSFPEVNHELRFLLSHYPAAYQVDRTQGTNPIRQRLANLDEAGQLYGPIIYQKAPIVMRQLELLVGEEPFREGLREYLKDDAFGNATWLDLVRILDARTPMDLAAWSRVWVEERGRPAFSTTRVAEGERTSAVILKMEDPFARGLVWPQRLRVTFGHGGRTTDVTVDARGGETRVPVPASADPLDYVLPSGGGLGYGLFLLDDASREYLIDHVETVADALTRGSAWVTLWDHMIEGRLPPARLVDAAARALPAETDEQNAERVLAYLARGYWRFLDPGARATRQVAIESMLRDGLARARTASQKAAWFNTLRDIAQTPSTLEWLTRVWRREEPVPGLPLVEPDEMALALELAVRGVPAAEEILRIQHERIANPDRKAQFAFVMPALSADPAERERAFDRFRSLENRRREAWVLESLKYLNHPLRAEHARRFIGPALDLLLEIRRTGDIFFPTRWMESTLWGHRSPEAAQTVRGFLDAHPDYPERLRWTILQTADELERAVRFR